MRDRTETVAHPTPDVGGQPGSRTPLLLHAVRWLSTVAAAGALISVTLIALRNWRQWHAHTQSFAVPGLVLAFCCVVMTLFVLALAWGWSLRQFGARAARTEMLHTWFTSNLYKYLPGQVWMVVGRGALGARFGVPARTVVAATTIEQVFAVLASGLALTAALGEWAVAAPLLLACVASLHPRATDTGLAVLSRVCRRPVTLTPLRTRQLLVLWMATWMNLALGLAALSAVLWACGALDASHARTYVVAMTASFLSGYFFFGAPAGLGVREGVMLAVLRGAGLSIGQASAVPLVLRLLSVCAEVSCFAAVAMALRHPSRPRPAAEPARDSRSDASAGDAEPSSPSPANHLHGARLLAGALLVAHFLVCVAWGVRVPVFDAPDEPAHYNYVLALANYHSLPTPAAAGQEVYSEGFQPPAYYLLAAVFASPTGLLHRSESELRLLRHREWECWTTLRGVGTGTGSGEHWPWPPTPSDAAAVHLLRLLSALLSTATILCIYLAAREIAPNRAAVPLLAAGAAGFLPQFTFLGGAVTSDSLSNLLAALGLFLVVRGVRRGSLGPAMALVLGLVAGAALLSKLMTAFLPAVFLPAVVLAPGHRRRALLNAGLFLLALLALSGWWFVRNWLHTHAGVAGAALGVNLADPATQDVRPQGGQLSGSNLAFWFYWFPISSLTSAWGVFGWMNKALPAPVYFLYASATGAALAGLPAGLSRVARRDPLGFEERRCVSLLLASVCALLVGIIWFNAATHQAQGRYLFGVLGPLAILAALGWTAPLPQAQTRRLRVAPWVASLALGAIGTALLLLEPLATRVALGRLTTWFASGPHRYPFAYYVSQFTTSYDQGLAIVFGLALGIAPALLLRHLASRVRARGSDLANSLAVAGVVCAIMASANLAILVWYPTS